MSYRCTLLYALIPIVCFPLTALAQSTVEYCTPFRYFSTLKPDSSEPFLRYILTVQETRGKKSINIVADELRVNKSSLGSIIRSAASVDRSIDAIRFDARRIIFEEPLSLEGGRYVFLAEYVEFRPGSFLALLPSSSSYYSIIARQVRFVSERARHFDVRARPLPIPQPDEFRDITTILDLSAETVWSGSTEIQPWEINDFLARRFTRYPITNFSNKIKSTLGEAGRAWWVSSVKAAGAWPQYTASVWRSAFRVAPFNEEEACNLKSEISDEKSLFRTAASAQTYNDVLQLEAAIESGVDLDGNGAAWATNRPLSSLRKEIGTYKKDESAYRLFDFYVAALTSSIQGTPLPAEKLNAEVGRIGDLIRNGLIEYNNSTSQLNELEAAIDAESKKLTDLEGDYKVREARLKQHAEDLERGAQDRARIISAIATAASIVATAYTGNPSTGAAVGGVIYAIGNAAEGRSAWNSLSAGAQFASAIKGPLTDVKNSLGELRTARGQYKDFIASFTFENITIREQIEVPIENPELGGPTTRTVQRDEALRDLGEKGKKLSDGVNAIFETYQEYIPDPSPISAILEEDATLKELGGEIAKSLERVKKAALEIEAAQRITLSQQVNISELTEYLYQISNLPVNDEEKRRALGQIAFDGARSQISRFSTLVERIRSVSLLEYQQDLPVDPNLVRAIYLSERLSAEFDPTKSLTTVEIGNEYLKLLGDRRIEMALLAAAVDSAATLQFERYVEFRGRAPSLVYPVEEIIDSRGASERERIFLDELNLLLEDQFNARNNPVELAQLYAVRLEIPFEIKRKIDVRMPARLLQVAITRADRTGGSTGGDLVFTLDVERVGNIRKSADFLVGWTPGPAERQATCPLPRRATITSGNDCVSVDLRPKETPPSNYYMPYEYTLAQIDGGDAFERSRNQSYWYLTPEDTEPGEGRTMLVTYPPAEARILLRARLDPITSWLTPPKVTRMDITAEVFQ